MTKKKDKVDLLYEAVQHYVDSIGGSVVMAGGIQIQQFSGDREFTYYVAVRCTGRKPLLTPQRERITNDIDYRLQKEDSTD